MTSDLPTPIDTPPPSRMLGQLCLGITLLITGAVLAVLLSAPLKDDNAWLFYVSRALLHGERLYVDVVEVNPPLIIWLYALPVALADQLALPAPWVIEPLIAAAALASAWASASLLRGTDPLFAQRAPVATVIALVLLLVPGLEFGQREHLLTIAVLPYLCCVLRELNGPPTTPRMAAGIGGLGALGCALKPASALALLLLEVLLKLRGRRMLRPQSLAAFATLAAYAQLVLLLHPDYLRHAVPMALALYGASDTSVMELAKLSWRSLFGEAACLALLCLGSGNRHRDNLLLVPTLFGAGALVTVFLAHKPWFYHRIPGTIVTMLGLLVSRVGFGVPGATVAPANAPGASGGNGWMRQLAASVLVGSALLHFSQAATNRLQDAVERAAQPDPGPASRIEALIRREHAVSYIAFSDWIGLGFPVVSDTGVAWGSRFDSMWALDGEMWRSHQDGHPPAAWPIRRWVANDFLRVCPDLAVVDDRGGPNYPALIAAVSPAFRTAWRHYVRIAGFDGLVVFRREAHACRPAPHPTAPVTAHNLRDVTG
jgi:hypothetical protein